MKSRNYKLNSVVVNKVRQTTDKVELGVFGNKTELRKYVVKHTGVPNYYTIKEINARLEALRNNSSVWYHILDDNQWTIYFEVVKDKC